MALEATCKILSQSIGKWELKSWVVFVSIFGCFAGVAMVMVLLTNLEWIRKFVVHLTVKGSHEKFDENGYN